MASKQKNYDVVIIGAGALGSYFAYELSKYNLEVMLCEAKPYLHSYYDENYHAVLLNGYEFATDNALNQSIIAGSKMWKEQVLPILNSPVARRNLMIPSFNDKETVLLHQYYQRSLLKNINKKDLKIIDAKLISQKEPAMNAKIQNSFFDKNIFLVDIKKALQNLVHIALANNLTLSPNAEITSIEDAKNGFYIKINGFKQFFTKSIINTAGLNTNNVLSLYNQPTLPLKYTQAYYLILNQKNLRLNNIWIDHCMLKNEFRSRNTVFANLNEQITVGSIINNNVNMKWPYQYNPLKPKALTKAINQWFAALDMTNITKIYYQTTSSLQNSTDFYFNPCVNNKFFMTVAGYDSYGWIIAPYLAQTVVSTWKEKNFVMTRKEKKTLVSKVDVLY